MFACRDRGAVFSAVLHPGMAPNYSSGCFEEGLKLCVCVCVCVCTCVFVCVCLCENETWDFGILTSLSIAQTQFFIYPHEYSGVTSE